jgi:hypothetical protein
MGCDSSRFEGYGLTVDQADQNLKQDMKPECTDIRFYYFDGKHKAKFKIDHQTIETTIHYHWDGTYWYATIL